LQAFGQTGFGGVRGAGVRGGRNPHAEEAGNPRTQRADHKTQHDPALVAGEHHGEQDCHHHDKDGQHTVFPNQKGHRAIADGFPQRLHFFRTRALAVDPPVFPEDEEKGEDAREESHPKRDQIHAVLWDRKSFKGTSRLVEAHKLATVNRSGNWN